MHFLHITPVGRVYASWQEVADEAHADYCQGGWQSEWTQVGRIRVPCLRCQPEMATTPVAEKQKSQASARTNYGAPPRAVWYPHLTGRNV